MLIARGNLLPFMPAPVQVPSLLLISDPKAGHPAALIAYQAFHFAIVDTTRQNHTPFPLANPFYSKSPKQVKLIYLRARAHSTVTLLARFLG
jgi:hypothetical protein